MDHDSVPEMTDEEKRRDQLLRAEHSTEADAAPRIEVTEHDGNTRIDIADTAAVRPGLSDDAPPED
ncbi:MAG: multidrug transporter [Microbacterium sp.]